MRADIAIIGAGIAGASLAAELAGHASVIVIEAEPHPGYHSTGRSAAFWSESYGGPLVQPLTTASGPLLRDYLSPRGALHIADNSGERALAALAAEFAGTAVDLQPVERRELTAILPGLAPGWDRGLLEASCQDIDVAALHADYLKQARRGGATLLTETRIGRIGRDGQGWRIAIRGGEVSTHILINAAGAWADDVAQQAQVPPLGIAPYRRTIAQVRVAPSAPADLPLVIDAAGRFYFKPESGRLWLSPHDETLTTPCDAAPEELDVALAIDWLERVSRWTVEAVERKWAGLRSFAPDRVPVYGFDPNVPDFFWCAGQGGFGIQTAPAAAKLAAALVTGAAPELVVAGIDPAPYAPERFAN